MKRICHYKNCTTILSFANKDARYCFVHKRKRLIELDRMPAKVYKKKPIAKQPSELSALEII